jgi:hypothetical protein
MVAAHDPDSFGPSAVPPTNRVIKILSLEGSRYKTFGENIILLLNREGRHSPGNEAMACMFRSNS